MQYSCAICTGILHLHWQICWLGMHNFVEIWSMTYRSYLHMTLHYVTNQRLKQWVKLSLSLERLHWESTSQNSRSLHSCHSNTVTSIGIRMKWWIVKILVSRQITGFHAGYTLRIHFLAVWQHNNAVCVPLQTLMSSLLVWHGSVWLNNLAS